MSRMGFCSLYSGGRPSYIALFPRALTCFTNVILGCRSKVFEELEIVYCGTNSASSSADDRSGDDDDRPAVLRGGESLLPRSLAMVHHYAEHVAPVASALGRQAWTSVTASRPAADSPRGSGAGVASRERKPAVGISTHRRGARRAGRRGSATSVRTWLREAGLGRRQRPGLTGTNYTSASAQLARGRFLHRGTLWLQRLYVLFFIELATRRVHFAGCTQNPSGPWVTQQARQLTWTLAERQEPIRFLIRDRDQNLPKF